MTCAGSGKPIVPRWAQFGVIAGGFIIIAFTFGWLFRIQVEKNPLRLDEVDYFRSIQNLAEIGLPLFYAGEVDISPDRLMHLGTRDFDGREFEFYRYKSETGVQKEAFFALVDGHSQYIYGMWHPPLYIYLAAIAYRFFPLTPANSELLRYFNLVFSVATMVGMVKLSAMLYAPRHWIISLGALALYLLNSFNIRGSSLIDYSATLAPAIVVWFAIACIRAREHPRISIGLVVMTVVTFYSSLGVATALLISVTGWVVVFSHRRIPWRLVAGIALGSVAFVSLFWIFCTWLDLPFEQPFIYNFWRSGIEPSNPWMAGRVEMTLRYVAAFAVEIGLFAVLGVGLLFLRAALSRDVGKDDAGRLLLPVLIAGALLLHAYLGANAWGFYKYILYALPLVFVYLVGEVVILAAGLGQTTRVAAGVFLFIILISQLPSTLAIARSPGGNLYLRQDQGVVEAGLALQRMAAPDDIILCPKDLAFFAERKFVDWIGWKLGAPAFVQGSVDQYDVKFVAQRTASYAALPDTVYQILDVHFPHRSEVGSFTLLSGDR
jgi:hypothetical protein